MSRLVSQLVGLLESATPYPRVLVMSAMAALALLGFVIPKRLATAA